MTLPAGAREITRVGGGDINEAYHLILADGREAFVKTRGDAAPGEYAAEARGLRWLAEPGGVRTPRVLDLDERYLALEWIAPGRLDAAGAEELGRGLAATHLAGARSFGEPGRESEEGAASASAGFGSLRLSNEPAPDWPSFYAERRLRPLARIARERGALTPAGIAAVERVCDRIDDLVGVAEPPARLHGDLWWGNVMADSHGLPRLIDPSAYGGHREIDLAMLRLFGGAPARLFDAYEEAAPLASGWEDRVTLYQLLPLLVHTLLFGGSYAQSLQRTARHYA